jgi:outer membrane immunogenic protein
MIQSLFKTTLLKVVLFGACAAAMVPFWSAPAHAADLTPLYKAPPPVYSSWTGFYVGGELGGTWGDGTWTATSLRDPPGIPPTIGIVLPIDASSPTDYRPGSLRYGGYVGYNWQFDPKWVAGIEGDLAYANGSASFSGFPGCALGPCTFPGSGFNAPVDSTSLRLQGDGSLRPRLGYLVRPNLMLFGTGGVAWQRIQTSGTCGPLFASDYCNGIKPLVPSSMTNTNTLVGWTAGLGAEWMFAPHWLARVEYRYADFGTISEVFPFGFSPIAGDNTYRFRMAVQTQMLSLGVAYKFDAFGGMR